MCHEPQAQDVIVTIIGVDDGAVATMAPRRYFFYPRHVLVLGWFGMQAGA